MTSWKIDVSHWPVVTEMPKSDTMVGSAALNCSCVKLPTNVIKVRMAIDTNAACVRWSFLYDSSPVSGWDRPWVRPCFAFIFFSGFTSDLFSGFDGKPTALHHSSAHTRSVLRNSCKNRLKKSSTAGGRTRDETIRTRSIPIQPRKIGKTSYLFISGWYTYALAVTSRYREGIRRAGG